MIVDYSLGHPVHTVRRQTETFSKRILNCSLKTEVKLTALAALTIVFARVIVFAVSFPIATYYTHTHILFISTYHTRNKSSKLDESQASKASRGSSQLAEG